MQGSMLKPTYSKLVFAWGLSGPFMTLPMRHPSIQRGALAISRVIFSYGAYPLYISADESKGMFSDIIQPML